MSALKRLLLIEDLKLKGYSNEEVENKIIAVHKWETLYTLIVTPNLKTKILLYTLLTITLVTIGAETGIFPIGKTKDYFVKKLTNTETITNK